ncbi:SGNH/GDSL hydrolase family protein [Pelomonas sp. Root1237]|uniref:SGNH/GDSL hydrolase family protein n=1 Tax=Pelomonas sp. Root1237 TaxID=1736434 RepID=UPI0007003CE7|nr:SGNH/GDSL hydrolase family protein [Pelomonas sp. Root1237]KQV91858.1 hypothetical protein ASC91_04385 [Pelomonas sp. Root1237]
MRVKHLLAGLLALCCAASAVAADPHWVTGWAAAPDSPGPSLQPQTIRQVVRSSVAGTQVRIRLSNLFGSAPLNLGPVHLALHAAGSAIQPGSDRALSFQKLPTVTIAPGDSVLSDPVELRVAALQQLALSLYLPQETGPSTLHGAALQTAWLWPGEDAGAATLFPAGATTDDSRYFVTDLEVSAAAPARTLVVVGDSITDGVGSADDRNARWPDFLAARLQGDPQLATIGVANAGIAGNRILNDGRAPFVGPSVLARFERDALSKPGVRWIVLMQGINDITAAKAPATPQDDVSAQQIIAGMRDLIAKAHASGLKIWGATLLPCGEAKGLLRPTPQSEAKRQAVNRWIRTAGAFDALLDFDRLLRDPARPDQLLPAFDSGDHLHPNEVGYQAMAAAVDLRWLK